MFSHCSDKLKTDIKNKFKNIKEEAFDDYENCEEN